MRRPSPSALHISAAPLLALAATFACAGCGRGGADGAEVRQSIVLISIDTLRADHLGATGRAAAATPNLDALARRGIVYENAVAAAPLTLPSHATLLSGLLPLEHGVRDNTSFRFPSDLDTLATTLSARGYRTLAALGGEPLAKGCGLERGFDEYEFQSGVVDGGGVHLAERPADRVTDAALALLDRVAAGEPFFLFAHYFDPHAPYLPPEPFATRFADSPYDGEIAFVDREIGRLLDGLRARGRLDGAVVLVTADHGESLDEHGEPTHGFFVYDATIRVPLIVAGPNVPARGADPSQVRLQDVRGALERLARGEAADLAEPARRGEPALIESLYGSIHCDYAQLRGLRAPDGTKYLEAGDEELYRIAEDPGELRDLAPDAGARADLERARAALASRLRAPAPRGAGGELGALPGYLSTPLDARALNTRTAAENRAYPAPRARTAAIQVLEEGVRLHEAGAIEAAAAALARGVELDPNNPALRFWHARALRSAAVAARDGARLDQAIAEFQAVLQLRPTHGAAEDLLIHCLAQRGRYQEAVDLALAAEAGGRAGAKTCEALGKVYLTERGSFASAANPLYDEAKAEAALERAIERGGDRPDPAILQFLRARYSERKDAVNAARIEDLLGRLRASR